MGLATAGDCAELEFGVDNAAADEGKGDWGAGFPFALLGVADSKDWVEVDVPCSGWDKDVG